MFSASLYKVRLQLERLSLRERYLLLIIIFSLVILIAQGILIVTGLDNHEDVITRTEQYKTETQTYQKTMADLQSAANNPRIIALQNNNQRLEETIKTLDERIDKIASLLITPERMAQILEQLLNEQQSLTLETFNVLPAIQLQSNTGAENIFYQHTIEISLSGQFESLVSYLEIIEALPEELFWDDLLINTQSFPILDIKLKVHTLSRQEEWLNV
jgi:MSHA biogenesis protein MshJ